MNKAIYHLWEGLRRRGTLTAIMLIAAVTAFFLPVLAGWQGIFHNDLAKESFPRYFFIANNLQHGILPLWDPQTWCGAIPFYALYLSDTYYLPLWPSFLLTNLNNLWHTYWSLILLPLWLHYVLGAGGLYLFLRRLVGCNRFAAYCGALAYVFSSSFTYAHVWPQAVFALAWLPWLLIIYAQAVERLRIWKIIAGGFIFSAILTSGQITYWHFVLFLWLVVVLFVIKSGLRSQKKGVVKRALVVAALIFAIGIGLSSVYLFSFIDGVGHTQEHVEMTLAAVLNREGSNLPPFYLATLFVPNLFSNITGVGMLDIIPDQVYFWEANMSAGMAVSLLVMLALALALVAPVHKFQDWQKRFWAVAFSGIYVFAVLCALGKYTPFYKYVIGWLPVINTLPFAVRYRMLQCLAAAVLIPISLDYLLNADFILRAKAYLRRWVFVYISLSFLIVTAGMAYSFGFCRYKIIDHWSEATLSAINGYLPIAEGIGRYGSAYFATKKLRIAFEDESFGEIRYADNAKVSPAAGTLAAYYYAPAAGIHEFDVKIPPRKFIWIRQKSGNARIGYSELAESRKIFSYDKDKKEWRSGPRVNAIWFYYAKVFPGKEPPLILGEGNVAYQEKSNLSAEAQLRRNWIEEFVRVTKEEGPFRWRIFSSALYWILFSGAIILGLYYLAPKRFGYFLGVIALAEFIIFAAQVVYVSGYGWYTGNDLPQRYIKPLDRPIVEQMLGPLKALDNHPDLRISTLTPYFDNYVRLRGRSALKGFGMHPMETRFKRAFETAYGRPVDWDYYNNAHKPVHLSFLNNFSVVCSLNSDPENIFPGGTNELLPGPLGLRLHFNPNVLPRAFTLDRVVKASEEEQLNQLVSGDLRRAVYLGDYGNLPAGELTLTGAEDAALYFANLQQINRIQMLDLGNPNRIGVEIEVNKPAMLVLTEVWYPGWQATIDGRSAPVYRVNYCQRGVWLEKGKHQVRFLFRPLAWRWGMGVSLGTIALLACLSAIYKLRKRPKK